MLPSAKSLSLADRSTALTPRIRDSRWMSRRSTVSRLSRRSETGYRFPSEAIPKDSTSELVHDGCMRINSYLRGTIHPTAKADGLSLPLNPTGCNGFYQGSPFRATESHGALGRKQG